MPHRRAGKRDASPLGERLPAGSISRDDVAALLAAVLRSPATIGASFDAVAGETPIAEALASISAPGSPHRPGSSSVASEA